MHTYLKAWKLYAVFRGRSTRAEYWTFTLVNGAVGLALLAHNQMAAIHALIHHLPARTGQSITLVVIYDAFVLAQLVPAIAVQVRRLHDLGRRGSWLWIVLVPIAGWILLFVWFCMRGTDEPNRYGPDPLARDNEPVQPG